MTEGRLTVGLTDLKLQRENVDICMSVRKHLFLVCIKENLKGSPLPGQLCSDFRVRRTIMCGWYCHYIRRTIIMKKFFHHGCSAYVFALH